MRFWPVGYHPPGAKPKGDPLQTQKILLRVNSNRSFGVSNLNTQLFRFWATPGLGFFSFASSSSFFPFSSLGLPPPWGIRLTPPWGPKSMRSPVYRKPCKAKSNKCETLQSEAPYTRNLKRRVCVCNKMCVKKMSCVFMMRASRAGGKSKNLMLRIRDTAGVGRTWP